jgi:hypothetical protein
LRVNMALNNPLLIASFRPKIVVKSRLH